MKLVYAKPEEVNIDSKKLKEIEKLTKKAIKDKITMALNMIVVRHGKIVYHKAIGNLNLSSDSPAAPLDALYSVRSVSKPITATLIMMLHEKKLLNINDPVSKYIHEFKGKWKSRVKIHHLLTHTSGMSDDGIYKSWEENHKNFPEPPKEEIPSYIKRGAKWWLYALQAPLYIEPGKEMSYSNTGYNMLGFIVTIVTGKTLNAFAKQSLFKPLGMVDTSYSKSPRQIEGRVVERIPREGEKVNWMSSNSCYNRVSGCCSVSTTALDLAIFGQMILNGGEYDGVRYLTEKSVKLMTTNRLPGIEAVWGEERFKEAAWGYGFNTNGVQDNFPTNQTYNHGGYAGSCIMFDPILDTVVVMLKALNFHNNEDYPGVFETAIHAFTDYESLKTEPLS